MTQDYEYLLYSVDVQRKIATVTLNRPRYRNALSRRLSEEVGVAFQAAAADDNVNVIVLSSTTSHSVAKPGDAFPSSSVLSIVS